MWGHEGFSEMPDTGNKGTESHCAAGSGAEWDWGCDFFRLFNLWNSPSPFAKILQTEEPIPTGTVWFCSSSVFFLERPRPLSCCCCWRQSSSCFPPLPKPPRYLRQSTPASQTSPRPCPAAMPGSCLCTSSLRTPFPGQIGLSTANALWASFIFEQRK